MKNDNLKLKISALFLFSLLIFPLKFHQTEAASTTLAKTVEFFIGQETAVKGNGEDAGPFLFNANIPESIDISSIKSAIVEINGVSYNTSGDQIINVDLKQNSEVAGLGTDYTLARNDKPKSFNIKHNVLGTIDPIVSSYTLYLKVNSTGGRYSVLSAKLILTYQYPASGSELLKTTKFFIEQKVDQVGFGSVVSRPFTISISEKSDPEDTPLIRSVFAEISGSARGNASGTIEAKITKPGDDPGYSLYNLDLGSPSCGAFCVTPFLIRYDASSIVANSDFSSGSNDYTFYFKGTGLDTNILSAKLIITYKYSVATGNLPARGELISSTFDTGVVGGAAYNSLTWKGTLNGGKVWMQLATADDISGPWNFYGPSCIGGEFDNYQLDSPDTPLEIMCANAHNNKRFFRYKIILCSDDCQNSGSNNPEVTGVVVNWSK